MKVNTKKPTAFTHEGAPSKKLQPVAELRRSIMACMLWEDSFYEDGQAHALRVQELIKKCSFDEVANIAIEAREKFKLRHAPLLLTRELIRTHNGRKVGDLIARVIQRPDEATELLAMYWSDNGDQPLTNQMKIGLARALKKFSPYQLSKWNKDGNVKLRDVLFLSHAKPKDEAQAETFKALAEDKLPPPDTWEVALSGGADKKEAFTRLIEENKLGALAMLRNLRNMQEAKVSSAVIRKGLLVMKTERVLPYRFIAAAKYAPNFEPELEQAMFRCIEGTEKLKGKTVLLVDHSGSMENSISSKSDLSRFDAACGLAMIVREVCEEGVIVAFSDRTAGVPARRGFALRDAIKDSMQFGSTDLRFAVNDVNKRIPDHDRLIVITDEQSATKPQHPLKKGYIINVANYQNGIGYGPWITINGWSEAIIDYIKQYESD